MYQFVIAALQLATATASLRLPDGTEGQLSIPLVWLLPLLGWVAYKHMDFRRPV